MTTTAQILEWFNWERSSALSERFSYWVWLIRETSTPDNEKRETAQSVVNMARLLPNPLEQAEVLVHCGIYYIEIGLYDDARRLLLDARNIYELRGDHHHTGVIDWAIYMALHRNGEFQQAYFWAASARNKFTDFIQLRARQSNKLQEKWYRERVLDFTCNLASSPHYIYIWMTEEPRGRKWLRPHAVQIRDQLSAIKNRGSARETYEKMELLLGVCRESMEPCESAEAYAYCGLVEIDRGNRMNAIRLYRSAVSHYRPGSHEQVHARWMLGLAQMESPENHCDGIKNLETCLEDMKQLKTKADQQNKEDDRRWYEAQSEGMLQALNQLLRRAA